MKMPTGEEKLFNPIWNQLPIDTSWQTLASPQIIVVAMENHI